MKNNNNIQEIDLFYSIDPETRYKPIEQQPREYAGQLLANSLEEIFRLYKLFISHVDETTINLRPIIAIGDMVLYENNFYMLTEEGFKYLCNLAEE